MIEIFYRPIDLGINNLPIRFLLCMLYDSLHCMSCVHCMSLITAVFTAQSSSSVWLQFHWFLNLTMLFSSLHYLPLHSTQGRAERSTLYSWVHRVHGALSQRPSYLWQSTLPTSILTYLGLGLIKNACSLGYRPTAKRGGGVHQQ